MRLFFSITGYGNIAPTETFGRYFMIAYALIGMPVNGILYAYLGEYFGSRVRSAIYLIFSIFVRSI